MGVLTILASDDTDDRTKWRMYVTEFDRETSKTPQLDLVGLGIPKEASDYTLEQVLGLMYQNPPAAEGPGRIALIFTHCNPTGFIMRFTENARSAETKWLRAASRAWQSGDEIIALRKDMKQPGSDFHALYKRLLDYLTKLDPLRAAKLPPINKVVDRKDADHWYDSWWDLMAKAILDGDRFTESDLRRICWTMQQVRNQKYDRVEIRACNLGTDTENLNALAEFFGAKVVLAPKTTMFFGDLTINLPTPLPPPKNPHVRGNTPEQDFQPLKAKLARDPHNRVIKVGGSEVVMKVEERSAFKYNTGLWAVSRAVVDAFFKTFYKSSYVFTRQVSAVPVGGLDTASSSTTPSKFVLPLESEYRTMIVSST